MTRKYHSGNYLPQNPDKYIGSYPIVYRSSWELVVCRMCDNHQNILEWASEPVKIPYQNPITNKYTVYIPDFLIVYENTKGDRRVEILEIKPKKETMMEAAKSARDKMFLAVNAAKWKAAQKWCSNHGMVFRVINEDSIFRNPKKGK